MSREKQTAIWTVLTGLAAALVIATFVARSVAADEVRAVDKRVVRLETQREEDVKKIDEIRTDVKKILRALPGRENAQ